MTAPISGVPPLPLQSALRAINDAHRTAAEVAQNVAEGGTDGLAKDLIELSTAELQAKAAIEVARTATEMDREVIDILA
ncbi:MAG: hypothetical protein QGF53_05715 [Alphaproteobacteria bacterium]|jgi:flagellar hook-basal body complex protein FliE|nr:hypothetical protein [Alphaproteobacteria bacterium]